MIVKSYGHCDESHEDAGESKGGVGDKGLGKKYCSKPDTQKDGNVFHLAYCTFN